MPQEIRTTRQDEVSILTFKGYLYGETPDELQEWTCPVLTTALMAGQFIVVDRAQEIELTINRLSGDPLEALEVATTWVLSPWAMGALDREHQHIFSRRILSARDWPRFSISDIPDI